jgi:hypothetical protein
LHVSEVWRNTPSVKTAILYLALIAIMYFGIVSWICLLLNVVEHNYPKVSILLHPITQATRPSLLLVLVWLVFLLFDAILAVPFIMTRAHTVHSTLLNLGSISYFFYLIFATLSAYGFLWNLTEQLFNHDTNNPHP